VLFSLVTALIAHLRHREYRALTAHLEAEARQSETSRQLAESKLKLLQLQIEPHFLFNTLGSAQQLAEKGSPEAARLIGELIRFLRAAAPALRDEMTTVREEAAMIRAYLTIMQTRLGRRLAWSVSVADDIADCAIPPGMFITLTENAIKHGIEPASRGGRVDVTAERENDNVVLVVADTGAGLTAAPTAGGIGLANIRERLELLYGPRAELSLEENEPAGFRARIVLPAAACARDPVRAFTDASVAS
jgi:sensor histidine kinase YesM